MNIKFNAITPNLAVKSVNASVDFYRENFGFQQIATVPETGELVWAMIQRDDVLLMFQEVNSLTSDLAMLKERVPGGCFTLYVQVKEVMSLYESVKNKVSIISHLDKTFYGATEFSITDPDGYVLTFSERVQE